MAPSTPLTQEQQNVLELTQLAGLDIREDVFLIIWELMQSDVPPMMVLQLLKSLAGVGPETASPGGSSRFGASDPGA
jgi:hypothetical protein